HAQRHVIPITPQLVARLVALGVTIVILQIAAVSQIELFGTNADLSPLVIASVGLMVGSLPGAVFGFCVGLFIDLALVQTLGLSSLVYVAIGYWAGRLLELRDPQGALVPFAVDAPVSFLLVREILATILLNALISGVVYAIVRRWLLPALPEDPRRRRRRAYTTGGLSPLSRA